MKKPAGEACQKCPLKNAKYVMPERSLNARLAVIGEAPSQSDLEQQRPFVGPSGRMMMKGTQHIGLRRADVHWTYAALCEVRDPDHLKAARKACSARLVAELAAAEASVLVPLGSHSTRSVLQHIKSTPIRRWRGSVTPINLGERDCYVCPTLHPAFVSRMPKWTPIFELDVERIGRVLRNGWQPPEHVVGREFRITRTVGDLARGLGELQKSHVGFDVETVGLGATETRLVCLAISDGQLTLIVPWSRDLAGMHDWWHDPDQVAELITRRFADVVVVTHNGPIFDHIVAERYGIRVNNWEDTLQASHAIESQLPRGLGRVATTHLDIGAWKEAPHADSMNQMWYYNGQDALYTILAWREIQKRVAA